MTAYEKALRDLNHAAYAALRAAKGKDDRIRAELMALAYKSDELVEAAE